MIQKDASEKAPERGFKGVFRGYERYVPFIWRSTGYMVGIWWYVLLWLYMGSMRVYIYDYQLVIVYALYIVSALYSATSLSYCFRTYNYLRLPKPLL